MSKRDYAPRFIAIESFDRRWEALGLKDEDLRANRKNPMSKVNGRPGNVAKGGRKRVNPASVSPRVREMVGELHKLCDAVEGGMRLDEAARVRTAPLNTKFPLVSPEGVRAVRESLGLNQSSVCRFPGCRATHVAALGTRGRRSVGSCAAVSGRSPRRPELLAKEAAPIRAVTARRDCTTPISICATQPPQMGRLAVRNIIASAQEGSRLHHSGPRRSSSSAGRACPR